MVNFKSFSFRPVTYAPKDPKTGKNSIDKGLKFANKEVKQYDTNKNGTTTVSEMQNALGGKGSAGELLSKLIDLNADNKISSGEYLAWTMFTDSTGNMDGTVSGSEKMKATISALVDPKSTQSQMQKLYDGHNLAERENKTNNTNTTFNLQELISKFMDNFGIK